ncbi:MAG: Mrp/NBP35 family ATP-binding protein [Rickettsiales bacterium]|nr:Mrp/NBP35 family ATP-binding protein [Rickettsiales bacterium]
MSDAHPAARKPAEWNKEGLANVRRIVAVASGKGGVGKSTTTVNLGHSLSSKGFRVGILDADIYGPSIPLMMGLGDKTPPAVEDGAIIPYVSAGIQTMSMGYIAGDQAAVWRGPMVSKALNQMLRGVAWGDADRPLDVLLVDMPPGTGDIHLSMVQQAPIDGALIVTTPQQVATIDAAKAVSMFHKVNVPVLGIIENMAYFTDPQGHKHAMFGEGGGKAVAAQSDAAFLGSVALDPRIGVMADAGSLNALLNDDVFAAYHDIADRISTAWHT